MLPILPTVAAITQLHNQALSVGGPDGLRDAGALDGAVMGLETTLSYQNLTPGEAAAQLAWRLAKAHAFVDGNKRTAALAFDLTLSMNGWRYTGTSEDLARAIIDTAGSTLGLPKSFTVLVETHCGPNPTTHLLMAYDQGRWPPET